MLLAATKDGKEDLSKATSHLLEECRTVLPGVQALFGFQWVAFFNQRFTELSSAEQRLHLTAVGLIAVAAALVMTPAAYHRSLGLDAVDDHFLRVSTRLIFASMFLLSLGIAIDFYIVSTFVLGPTITSVSLAVLLWVVLAALWFAFPMTAANGRRSAKP
jgi:hypothetical protein